MARVTTPDSELVKSYIDGNEEALSILINRHQSKIFGFICSKIQDRAICEDLFQDTFFKVVKTIKSNSYNEQGKFLPWVMRISHNLIIDYFRNSKKMPMQYDTEDYSAFNFLKDNSLTTASKMFKDQVAIDLKNLVDTLPDEQKEVIKLRIYNDLSYNEISELTGVSVNTALGRMRYAIINIRRLVNKHQIALHE